MTGDAGHRLPSRAAEHARSGASEVRDARSAASSWGLVALVASTLAGCAPQRQPVIPHAAFVMREAERHAIEGRDTTRARVVYPEFVGARTPEALDSLRATVHALLVAPVPGRRAPAGSIATLLDGFVAYWNAEREARRLHEYWRFDRRVEVAGETLGTVALVAVDRADLGAASTPTGQVVLLGADDGRRVAEETLADVSVDSIAAVVGRLRDPAERARRRR